MNVYTVTYDGNGGSPATATASVEYGQQADLTRTCTFEGHIFLGWALEQTATQPIQDYTVLSDVTLYAVYGLPVTVDIPVTEIIGDTSHTEYTKHGMMGIILMLIPLMLALFLMITIVRGLNLGVITKD